MAVILNCEAAHVSLVSGGFDCRRPLVSAELVALNRRYALAREVADIETARPELLAIGRALYGWLDGAEGWLAALRPALPRPFVFEVRAPLEPAEAHWAVLHAPWELLADARGFLAGDAELGFAPTRRLGRPGPAPALDDYRLGVAFMAAAPRGARELDFEAEEAAILAAAGQDLDLFVEESGNAEELSRRLARLKPALPVLHLSCHGDNTWRGRDGTAEPQPVLLLEDPTGGEQPTPAGRLIETLGAYRPRLLFLSACLTAVAADRDTLQGKTQEDTQQNTGQGEARAALSDALTARLVRAGVEAVLGWDGSVADVAATAFARALYDDLGKGVAVAQAAATARRGLLNSSGGIGDRGATKDLSGGVALRQRLQNQTEALRRDWHLARVWLGAEGGGPVVEGGFARSLVPPGEGHKRVLAARGDETLAIASPAMFVGRRRALQRALRVLAGRDKAGLLLHGMGRLGKSSLAARIIDRRPDLTPVVVFGAYDALSVVDVLAKALEEHEPAVQLIAARRALIRDDPTAFDRLLVQLLAGPCRSANGGRPVLLLVDDLERILEPGAEGQRHQVKAAFRPGLRALLAAFDPRRSDSRLVLTSRFPFALVEGGIDLARQKLELLELGEFTEGAREKLALRQMRAAQAPPEAGDRPLLDAVALAERLPLLARARTAARGNPGLQDLLGADVVLHPTVPPATAEIVLEEVERYLAGGPLPGTAAVQGFLKNLDLDSLLILAGPSGQDLLRAVTLFSTPVPEGVIAALATTVGGEPRRLRDLGLLVPSEDLVQPRTVALAANGLAAGRVKALSEAERGMLAQLALPVLWPLWGGVEAAWQRPAAADIAFTTLALAAGDVTVLSACAAAAVQGMAAGQPAAAGQLGEQAIGLLEAAGHPLPLRLLARTGAALQTAGDGVAADGVLAKGRVSVAGDDAGLDAGQLSSFLFALGDRQFQAGVLDAALATFERLCTLEAGRDNAHQLAEARGRIADVLQMRGELDVALRIHQEETLPVYMRLGDVREIALTQGRIADIFWARGELEAALRIRQEEELPVYTRLGDVREIAVTQGKIADIHHAHGELDEALRIRREEQLPVYTRLGDVRSIALTQGKIADVLWVRGELDTALRIRQEEELPVYTRLGDVRSIAVTQGKIADILQARGELDTALRIRQEEELPVYTRLGDVRSVAVTQGKIANILAQAGDHEGALKLHLERLDTNRTLGNIEGVAACLWDIAQIDLQMEDWLGALAKLEEAWPLLLRLGQADGIAVVGETYGQLLAAAGDTDAALAVLRESAAAYRKLGRIEEAMQVEGMIAP